MHSDTPISLNRLFSPIVNEPCPNDRAKHFVNHHSFLKLLEQNFSFCEDFGVFFVDGRLLKLILKILNIPCVYFPGPLFLDRLLAVTPKNRCFFVAANHDVGNALVKCGYHRYLVVPHINNENVVSIARELVAQTQDCRIILGIGSPNQDILAQNIIMINEKSDVNCVGAAVEFLVGIQKSCPLTIRKMGIEWLWRLVTNFRVTLPRVTTSPLKIFWLLINGTIKR